MSEYCPRCKGKLQQSYTYNPIKVCRDCFKKEFKLK